MTAFAPFAASTFWRSKLPALPLVNAASNQIINRLITFSNFHSVGYGLNAGVPLLDGTGQPRRADMTCRQGGADSLFNQRLRQGVPWVGGWLPGGGGDRSMVIFDLATDEYWEFNEVQFDDAGVPSCGWGGWKPKVSVDPWGNYRNLWDGKQKIGSDTWGSRASGLPLGAGLITRDDVERGYIDHALVLGVRAAAPHIWASPAQRTDGRDLDGYAVPEGACLTWLPSVDLTSLGLAPFDYMVARAVQDKGLYVADQTNGGTTFYSEAGVGDLIGSEHDASTLPWSELVVTAMQTQTKPDGVAVQLA